jgi:hypothetical protein
MTTGAERLKRIEALTPRQALHTVQYMTAWLDEQVTEPQDFTAEQQIEILNTLFHEAGYAPLPLTPGAKPDQETAGQAARKLLMVLAESSDNALLDELDHWLAKPPGAETKAILELMVVPVVLTACITALQTSFEVKRGENGQTSVKLTRTGIQDKHLKGVLQGMYETVKRLATLG